MKSRYRSFPLSLSLARSLSLSGDTTLKFLLLSNIGEMLIPTEKDMLLVVVGNEENIKTDQMEWSRFGQTPPMTDLLVRYLISTTHFRLILGNTLIALREIP